MTVAHERHTAALVVGLALGGLAGAGYVLFKTPRSGAEVRAGIKARIQGIADVVKETAGVVGVETRRAGEQTVERIEATGAAVRDRLPGAAGVADLVPGERGDAGSAPLTVVAPAAPDAPETVTSGQTVAAPDPVAAEDGQTATSRAGETVSGAIPGPTGTLTHQPDVPVGVSQPRRSA